MSTNLNFSKYNAAHKCRPTFFLKTYPRRPNVYFSKCIVQHTCRPPYISPKYIMAHKTSTNISKNILRPAHTYRPTFLEISYCCRAKYTSPRRGADIFESNDLQRALPSKQQQQRVLKPTQSRPPLITEPPVFQNIDTVASTTQDKAAIYGLYTL